MRHLNWWQLLTINAYWLAIGIASASMTPLLGPYLVNQFVPEAEKNAYYATMRVLGLLLAMAIQPIFGLISDRSTFRFGSRRPFILIGAILNVICLIGIGLAFNYWMLVAVMLFFQFSSNIAHGGLQGLIPDVVPNTQTGRASGIKAMFELLPVLLVAFTIGPMIANKLIWQALGFLIVVYLVTAAITAFSVKEKPNLEKATTPVLPPVLQAIALSIVFYLLMELAKRAVNTIVGLQAGNPNLAAIAAITAGSGMLLATLIGVWVGVFIGLGKEARRQQSFVWWIVNRLLFFTAVGGVQSFLLFFVKDLLGLSAEAAAGVTSQLTAIVGGFLLISALSSGFLSDRFGRRGLLVVAGLLAATAITLMVSLPTYTMLYISGSLLGLATGIFVTVNWALGTELVPPTQAARYLGLSNLAGAGSGMIASGIGGELIDFLNVQYPQSGTGYLVVFAGFAALCIVSVMVIFLIQRGREKETVAAVTQAAG